MWDKTRRVYDAAQNVAKFIFTQDGAKGAVAEAVLYKYPEYKTRTVICCSTQSGCPMGCRFCGAGDYFVRSLSVDEITFQVDYLLADGVIDCAPEEIERLQIMFMSMGEPLLNLKNLATAIRYLHVKYPQAALLISTSAPRVNMDDLWQVSRDVPTVGLQFSVHDSTDGARDKLIPFKEKLCLGEMANAGLRWHNLTGRKPFFNYCARADNILDDDADRIAFIFNPRIFCATVSVVCERSEGIAATNDFQRSLAVDFAQKLAKRGYDTRVFDPAGQDTIGGGCGQLWWVQDWMRNHPDKARPSVGHGKQEVHAPREFAECA